MEVLCALSFLPPIDAFERIPETFLEQLRLKGANFSKAAAILQLSSLRWNASEAADVLRQALALKKEYPDHLDQLLDFIDSGGKSGPHLVAFLVELLKQPLEWPMLSRAASLLVKLVERRPTLSTLPGPAIRPPVSRL